MTNCEIKRMFEKYREDAVLELGKLSRAGRKIKDEHLREEIREIGHSIGNILQGLNLLFIAGEISAKEKNKQTIDNTDNDALISAELSAMLSARLFWDRVTNKISFEVDDRYCYLADKSTGCPCFSGGFCRLFNYAEVKRESNMFNRYVRLRKCVETFGGINDN